MAAEHSLMSREHHFEDVVRGTTAGVVDAAEALATPPDELVVEWSAKCGAIETRNETRNETPQAPASAGEESQEMTEPAATSEVTAGSIDL